MLQARANARTHARTDAHMHARTWVFPLALSLTYTGIHTHTQAASALGLKKVHEDREGMEPKDTG